MDVNMGGDAASLATQSFLKTQSANKYSYAALTRLGIIMVPCLLLVLAASGKLVSSILIIGLIISYLLSEHNFQETSLVVFWLFLISSIVIMIYTGLNLHGFNTFSLFLLLNMALFLVLAGLVYVLCTATFIQRDFPHLLSGIETCVFSSLCLPSVAILMCSFVAVAGPENSPYHLTFILFFTYKLLLQPTISQFQTHNSKNQIYIVGKTVSAGHTILVVFLPAVFYFSIHSKNLSTSIFSMFGFSNVLLLLTIPILLLLYTLPTPISKIKKQQKRNLPANRAIGSFGGIGESPESLLWWSGMTVETLDQIRFSCIFLTLTVSIWALQQRIVMYAFSSYLRFYATHPVLNTALVTVSM